MAIPSSKVLIAYLPGGAGLGNRIRVMMAAKSLAEYERRRFYCVWPTGRQFGPKFSQLWQAQDPRGIPRVMSRLLARKYPFRYDDGLGWLDDDARKVRVWQIRTGGLIKLPPGARDWKNEFRGLRPVPQIAERIQHTFSAHLNGRPYVGVMIRAHDVSHPTTVTASPVDWYITRMRDIRRLDPGVPFYVSCDVPEIQQRVSSEIGDCFGLSDKGGYNTTEGVRSSVVDLYLLAASGYLLGPHYSTFVRLAHILSNGVIDLETSASGSRTSQADYRSPGLATDPLRPFARKAS
jgi:hypothetical protein